MSKIFEFGARDPLSVTESGNAVTVDVSAVAEHVSLPHQCVSAFLPPSPSYSLSKLQSS
jgi:hypothetical protein